MIVYPLKLAPGRIAVTALVGAIILLLAAGFRPAPDEGCEAVAQQFRVLRELQKSCVINSGGWEMPTRSQLPGVASQSGGTHG